MINPKIAPDTNVFVSACIFLHIPEPGSEIKDEFHDEAIKLFDFFMKQYPKKIGCILPEVKRESEYVLGKAVKRVVSLHSSENPILKEANYKIYAKMMVGARIRLENLAQFLESEDLDKQQVVANLKEVKDMSAHLKGKWAKSDKSDRQLEKFQKSRSNSQDEQILAEAITLMQKVERDGQACDFMIASFDGGFFSPRTVLGRVFDAVTREIWARFKIRCGSPAAILSRSGGRSQDQ